MRFTKVTREILDFINRYGFITANISSRVHHKGQKQGYIAASRKLREMESNKVLKRYVHPQTKEYIYQIQTKQITPHQKYLIELYSRIYELVDEIIYFDTEVTWKSSKRRSDGHIIYRNGDSTIGLLIEVDFSHYTSREKLVQIYENGEVQQWYKDNYNVDYFPSILILSLLGDTEYKDVQFDYITLDFEFVDIAKKLKIGAN